MAALLDLSLQQRAAMSPMELAVLPGLVKKAEEAGMVFLACRPSYLKIALNPFQLFIFGGPNNIGRLLLNLERANPLPGFLAELYVPPGGRGSARNQAELRIFVDGDRRHPIFVDVALCAGEDGSHPEPPR